MRKIALMLGIAIVASFSARGQAPAIEWTYSAGSNCGDGEEWAYDAITLGSNDYVIGGFAEISSVYVPVLVRYDNSNFGLPPIAWTAPDDWETQIADAGIIFDICHVEGAIYAVGSGPDPNNSDEPSILFVSVDANYGTIIDGPIYYNQYTAPAFSSSFFEEGATIAPIMSGPHLTGFVIAGTYNDLTYGLRAGTLVMKVGTDGAVDGTFNSNTGFRALNMHPGYPSVPPFEGVVVYGRPQAIVTYTSGTADGIVVAGTAASAYTDSQTGVFVTKLEMDGDIAYSCPDNPLSESVLYTELSYVDNNTSPSADCGNNSPYSFIDAGPYPYSNENNNTKVGALLQSSDNGNIILGLQMDYYFVYGTSSCGFNNLSPASYINTDFTLVELDAADLSLVDAENVGRFTALDFFTPVIDDGTGYVILGGEIEDASPDALMNNYVIKTDYDFDVQWEDSYFGLGDQLNCPFGITQDPDGGYLLCGNNDLDDEDFNLIRLATPSPRLANPNPNTMQVGMNAETGEVFLTLDKSTSGNTLCRIYSTDGRLLKTMAVPETSKSYSFSASDLAAGIYIVEMAGENGNVMQEKFAVVK